MNQYIITEEQLSEMAQFGGKNGMCIDGRRQYLADEIRSHPYNSQAERDELCLWLESEQKRYDKELSRLSKVAPHLKDKLLCLATDSSMCGQVLDKIKALRQEGRVEK